MALVVQKFGGTSLADADRIRRVAERVIESREEGNQVVAVVSAMGTTTDDLVDLAAAVSEGSHPREMDMLLTAGERVSMALVAMAIEDHGVPAVSFTGSQAGILTTAAHGEAEIVDITPFRVRDALDEGKVVIVAGFQGVSPDSRDVTTLGRGGSDTTAVALAAALEADVCEIYTDVDGIFTADPGIVADARKLEEITFDEMYEYATAGAGVLRESSVEFGRRYLIPIHVRSSLHDGAGTWVREETAGRMGICGVASVDGGRVSVVGTAVRTEPDVVVRVKEILSDAGVVGEEAEGSDLRLSYVVPYASTETAVRALHDGLIGGES
jgi:aspartate kinase